MRMHVGCFGGGFVAFFLPLPQEQTFSLSVVRAFLIACVTLSVVTIYEMLCTTLLGVFFFVAFSFSVRSILNKKIKH